MGTKTISLSEEAYEHLKSRKHEGESFSDVVSRLAGERPLLDIVGTGRRDDGVEDAIEAASANLDSTTERIADELDREDS